MMGMPWLKMPTDSDFRLHAIGAANRGYYLDLLRMKGRGMLDQAMEYVHVPLFHLKLTEWVATFIGVSKQRAVKLKATLLMYGLIDEHWQPLDWDALHGPRAHRATEPFSIDTAVHDKPAPLTAAEKQARYRQREKAKALPDEIGRVTESVTEKVTGVTESVTEKVTGVTESVTGVTESVTEKVTGVTNAGNTMVTRPENSPENSLENQKVTERYQNPLDIDLDLDSRSLKAKATREATHATNPDSTPVTHAQATATATRETATPSTPELTVTDVTDKAKATADDPAAANAGPAVDGEPAIGPPSRHAKGSVPADPALAFEPSPIPAAACPAEPVPRPLREQTPFTAPPVHENGPSKGIIHDHPIPAENEVNPMRFKKQAPATTAPLAKTPPLRGALMSLNHYLNCRRERGLNVIDDDHPLDEWSQSVGLPDEFLAIAWNEFEERYSKKSAKWYAYDYWPERFFKAVKTNQYRLWAINSQTQEYFLTSNGKQRKKEMEIRKNQPTSHIHIQPEIIKTPADENISTAEADRFIAELKRRMGNEFDEIFLQKKLIAHANQTFISHVS